MQTQTLTFSNEDISFAIEKIKELFTAQKVDRRTALRTALTAEEVLLQYQKHFGADARFTLQCTKRFGRVQAELITGGEPFDPFAETQEEDVLHALLVSADLAPAWAYRRGSNRVAFSAQSGTKISPLAQIVLALIGGLGLGFAASFLPNELGLTLSQKLLSPISSTIMGFLSAVAAALVFLSVASGVCSMGDLSTFNRVGKRTIARFLLMLCVSGAVAAAVLLPFFRVETAGGSALELSSYFEMLLAIVPKNLVTPFSEGNTMQIVFLALCMSLALLVLGVKTGGVTELILQANLVAQNIVAAVVRLLPVVVFVNMFSVAVSGALGAVIMAYKLFALEVLGIAALFLIAIVRICVSRHVRPAQLLKKLAPVTALAFVTASSSAVLTMAIEAAEHKLGVDAQLARVGVPLGQVVYKPNNLVFFPCAVLCMAEACDVPITVSFVITLMVTSLFLAVSMPPAPGACITFTGLLFTQFGIPSEAIAVVVALSVITDRINVAAEHFLLEAELVQLADSLGLLDEEKLHEM